MITSIWIAGAILSLLPVAGPIKADFYVAPNGSDANPGTEQAPFASLGKARDAVRPLVREGLTREITVLVRGGRYTLAEPLTFGPEDSGTAEHSITYSAYPDEQPIISGGRVITGWKKAERGKWVVQLPEVRAGKWGFRQLFADGVRLPRARFPNPPDLLSIESTSPDVKQIHLSQAPSCGNLAGKDAELAVYQNWSVSRAPIVASEDKTITTSVPAGWIGHHPATTVTPGDPAYVENASEFVDQPGEWYLDRAAGTLTYMAGQNENPNDRRFVAGELEQLVVVTGRPDAPVRSIRLHGLAFEYTEWPLPEFGYLGIQAGHHGTSTKELVHILPLAVEFTYAADCRLQRCRFAHTGACGIGFGAGCQRNQVVGCELFDIGGNGIMVGWRGKHRDLNLVGSHSLQADWKSPADIPTANEVSNNVIRACGAVNHGCVGIYDAFSAGTRIAHNLVADMPYTGISVGFRWDQLPTSQRECTIEYNHIHDCMKMLADGGGIYTLGFQPGTLLRGKLIHDIHRSVWAHGAPNNGMFIDEGSKGFHFEGNVIYRTAGEPIRFNRSARKNFTWKDNSFGIEPGDPAFPEAAAKKAGPLPQYRGTSPPA